MPTISAVMIVKNEARHISTCLAALQGVVDEIIVADTGSTDNTKELTRHYTDRLFEIGWEDDFAKARNQAISFATGEWILVVDADEVLCNPGSARQKLNDFIACGNNRIGSILVRSPTISSTRASTSTSFIKRFFPKAGFRFRGAIHEQIEPVNGPVPTAQTGVEVDHSGYNHAPHDTQHKSLRNIPLLRSAIARNRGDEYMQYQLGRALFTLEDFPAAISALEETLSLIQFDKATLPLGCEGPVSREVLTNAVVSLGYAYINIGQPDRAQELVNTHVSLDHPGTRWSDFYHFAGYMAFMQSDIEQARMWYRKSLEYGPTREDVEGTGSYSSAYHLGLLEEANQNIKSAEACYAQSLQYNAGYQPCLDRYIDFVVDYQLEIASSIQTAVNPVLFRQTCINKHRDYLGSKNVRKAAILSAIVEVLTSHNPVLAGDLLFQFQQSMQSNHNAVELPD